MPQLTRVDIDNAEIFYEPLSGEFYVKNTHLNPNDPNTHFHSVCKIRQQKNKSPVKIVCLYNRVWIAKRLAWIFVTGEDAWGNIICIDGNPLNTSWSNLKEQHGAKRKNNWKKDLDLQLHPGPEKPEPESKFKPKYDNETYYQTIANRLNLK